MRFYFRAESRVSHYVRPLRYFFLENIYEQNFDSITVSVDELWIVESE